MILNQFYFPNGTGVCNELPLRGRNMSFGKHILECFRKYFVKKVTKIYCVVILIKQKIRNCGQGPGLVKPTFFSGRWLKYYFSWYRVLISWHVKKNFFRHWRGPLKGAWELFGSFYAKKELFLYKLPEKSKLASFLRFFSN